MRKSTLPVTVILREIAKEIMLAKRSVKKTEKTETKTEFLKGTNIFPSAKRVRKLSKLNDFGSASGLV